MLLMYDKRNLQSRNEHESRSSKIKRATFLSYCNTSSCLRSTSTNSRIDKYNREFLFHHFPFSILFKKQKPEPSFLLQGGQNCYTLETRFQPLPNNQKFAKRMNKLVSLQNCIFCVTYTFIKTPGAKSVLQHNFSKQKITSRNCEKAQTKYSQFFWLHNSHQSCSWTRGGVWLT